MASSEAAGRPPVRGRTEAAAIFFVVLAVVTSEVALDLTSQESSLRASGIRDSVDLLAALTECIVVIFLFFFF